jgi:hypothetical protein
MAQADLILHSANTYFKLHGHTRLLEKQGTIDILVGFDYAFLGDRYDYKWSLYFFVLESKAHSGRRSADQLAG